MTQRPKKKLRYVNAVGVSSDSIRALKVKLIRIFSTFNFTI